MQSYLKIALFVAASVCAVTCDEEGEERLGYYSVASDGTTSLAFNATSIQNLVILGLFGLVLGALVLPLFGLSLGGLFGAEEAADTGYGYGYEQPAYGEGAYGNFCQEAWTGVHGPRPVRLDQGEEEVRGGGGAVDAVGVG
eukprot:TRINITY_DN3804_c0_g1_i5.p1 TRINITY_DN3804_c0_g1~~TRINITY_DN3804_c0_g1_i5.p1  ORF type:complete len:141 (-),score=28.15 TRINITY_DN3804_c0_g1_i5:52-474(-)